MLVLVVYWIFQAVSLFVLYLAGRVILRVFVSRFLGRKITDKLDWVYSLPLRAIRYVVVGTIANFIYQSQVPSIRERHFREFFGVEPLPQSDEKQRKVTRKLVDLAALVAEDRENRKTALSRRELDPKVIRFFSGVAKESDERYQNATSAAAHFGYPAPQFSEDDATAII